MTGINEQLRRSLRHQLLPVILAAGVTTPAWAQNAPAQNAPNSGGSSATVPGGNVQAARIAATEGLLKRADAAIEAKQYAEAVEMYRRARVNAQPLPELHPHVAAIRQKLARLGIEAALLDMPPAAPPNARAAAPQANAAPQTGLSQIAVPQVAPITDPAAAKAEALRLVAVGRAALERGDIAAAMRAVSQAEALGVPESAFEAGQPRVWQLALDVQSAARRRGQAGDVAPAGGAANMSGAVRQAGAVQAGGTNDDGRVVNSVYNATDDKGRVQPVQALDNAIELGEGETLFREGLETLSRGDTAAARSLFVEAWKHESTMDPGVRAQLKEKLTLLQPARLPEAVPPGMPLDVTPMQRAELEAQAETRRLYREITAELAASNESREKAPLETLDRLQKLRRKVADSKLDAGAETSLTAMVDRAISEQKQYVEANRGQIDLDLANDAVRAQLANEEARRRRIDDEIASLVETFNDLMEQRRYPEAEVVAKKVGELSPGSSIAKSMFHTSRMGTRLMINEEISSLKEDAFAKNMLAVDGASVAMDPSRDLEFPDVQSWGELSRRRQGLRDTDTRSTPAEKEIRRRLSTPVDIHYTNRPLSDVMQDLAAVTNIPIIFDNRALAEMRVEIDTPITLELTTPIKLQSALNIILGKVDLTYVIENDVLTITSREAKRSRVWHKVYRVADLVTPIPNFASGYEDGLAGALRTAYQMTTQQTDVHVMPVSVAGLAANSNTPSGSLDPKAMAQFGSMNGGSMLGPKRPGSGSIPGAFGGSPFANFEPLIELIEETIMPETWADAGGQSTIKQYDQNLSLVISTTTEVHDQIVELLESLRRLQNLQVTIEVRFITLSDSFFEQIGIDFDLSIDDNVKRLPSDDAGPSVTIGWDGIAGVPTSDFDIKLNQSLGVTPAFGAFDAGAGATIGFAILSDIEAFFFLQAAQGDARNNILQAPKVTLFDGQFATISDQTQRPFVTSIMPVVGDFAVAQQPIIVVLNEGTQLNVQAVVSDDKRFVRMTLVPFFSQIGDVGTFTYEGRRRRRSANVARDPVTNEPIATEDEDEVIEGTTVQQPSFAFTNISTVVSVPDGGTILLGGIKRMAEGRNERGVPILSKIPYISRLFRNVAIGRDARSLMMMVTPRIIIQEEEELAQTGFDPNR